MSLSDRQPLYDFWHKIPVIKQVPAETFHLIESHPIRNAMITVLRKGIEDETTGNRRYALSLKELKEEITEWLAERYPDTTISGVTTLYHHRDKLIDEGLIQVVATLSEPHVAEVTYYGRTARAFIGQMHGTKKIEAVTSRIKQIMIYLNPDEDVAVIEHNIEALVDEKIQSHERVMKWIEDHVDMLNDLDLDAIELYELIANFAIGDAQLLKDFQSYLHI